MTHTNGTRLERWLGAEAVERVSASMRNWYGPPIPLAGVPGKVYAARGGDFVGRIDGGFFASFLDFAHERTRRLHRALMRAARGGTLYMGFSSLSDLISKVTAGGNRRLFVFQKVGTTGVLGATNSLWGVGNHPIAGASGQAAPGGLSWSATSVGAFRYEWSVAGGATIHLTRADITSSIVANTLLLYDRLWSVDKTMNSTATEAVSGAPSRYQSTTGGADESAEGNFLFIECSVALPATAHNWTVCLYTDQGGTAGATLPSVTGNASNIVNRLDQPLMQWFCPLAAGDTGIRALTQMQCSALVASGAIDFAIGHPLAIFPLQVANQAFIYDGINSSFNLNRIITLAALAFLEINKPSTTASTYNGRFEAVVG